MGKLMSFSILVALVVVLASCIQVFSAANEILKGFSATPDTSSASNFQPLLTDSTHIFSLGFLRLESSRLALTILHLPSSQSVWRADIAPEPPNWGKRTQLSFNGSLLLYDSLSTMFWSSQNNGGALGDRLRLLNNSNLQIIDSSTATVVWQSFDFPSDTLLENQNFTAAMTLRSSNGLYSMSVIHNYLGLYADFKAKSNQIYWKHTALEAKAQILEGMGPIYARLDSDGFLGLYQTKTTPVDVMPFRSFQRGITYLRRLRLDPDGNLRGHFWNSSSWVLDFEAIQDSCELPSACGAYGLCQPGTGCSCIDNRTEFSESVGCFPPQSGDFCSSKGGEFWVLKRSGVDLPYKQLMGFEKVESLEACEGSCMSNCSCWGAVFSNVSGFCYSIGYPIQTVLTVGDGTKVGFFKVGKVEGKVGIGVGLKILFVGIGVLFGVAGFVVWWWWRRRWGRKSRTGIAGQEGAGFSAGQYKDLKTSWGSDSFKSVELCRWLSGKD